MDNKELLQKRAKEDGRLWFVGIIIALLYLALFGGAA
tara:strand:- start:11539 stop:11649 length:111 start_codon:yes stop_codon:yes gene_type:complete